MYKRRWLTRFIGRAGMTKCAEWSRLLPAPGGGSAGPVIYLGMNLR